MSDVETTRVRVTDSTTGGQKESTDERWDLMPMGALAQIARVYGMGAKKYDDHNWRKGYKWGLSFSSLEHHLRAWQEGQDSDPESGLPHLAHAAWHCLTLLTFANEHPELDDRWATVKPRATLLPGNDGC
jgi:hypothetical protein